MFSVIPEMENLVSGSVLGREEARNLMLYLASERSSDAERAAFLAA